VCSTRPDPKLLHTKIWGPQFPHLEGDVSHSKVVCQRPVLGECVWSRVGLGACAVRVFRRGRDPGLIPGRGRRGRTHDVQKCFLGKKTEPN
jgi:hypothetical protein